jgi:hypothetical protein
MSITEARTLHLAILGFRVRDRVTGQEGIVTSVSFDLFGCIQAVVHPGLDKDGKAKELHWYDILRLEIISEIPCMPQPNFVSGPISEGLQGAAEKPLGMRG